MVRPTVAEPHTKQRTIDNLRGMHTGAWCSNPLDMHVDMVTTGLGSPDEMDADEMLYWGKGTWAGMGCGRL